MMFVTLYGLQPRWAMGKKRVSGPLISSVMCREHVEWRCWDPQDFMASCTPLQSFAPNHNSPTHINTSHVLIDFHIEFLCEHLQVYFYCSSVTCKFQNCLKASVVGELQTLFLHLPLPLHRSTVSYLCL